MLKIQPSHLVAVYDCLRELPPFNRWRFPVGEEVNFHVTRSEKNGGLYWGEGEKHHIAISARTVSQLGTLMQYMAHEMLHMRQRLARTETKGSMHNAEFRKLSRRVCAIHGWDPTHVFYG